MYYDTIEEAIKAAPNCTHVLTTGPQWSGIKERRGKYAPAKRFRKTFRHAQQSRGRGFTISAKGWEVVKEIKPQVLPEEFRSSMLSDLGKLGEIMKTNNTEFYPSEAAARDAFPFDVIVLTTSNDWKGRLEAIGKYVPVLKRKDGVREWCHANPLINEKYDIAPKKWMFANYVHTIKHGPTIGAPQPTTEQRVTAARFDQAATERQVGGDHYKSLKIQPIEYIDANNLPYLEGNVVKYVTRHASKNGVQDIDKAIHYLELIKQMRYSEDNTSDN